MTYAEAKAERDRLENEYRRCSAILEQLSGGGPMNLTPNHVKATAEWQAARKAADTAFASLRKFNKSFLRQYKTEIREERRNRNRNLLRAS